MKNLLILTTAFLLSALLANKTYAQSEEHRNKIQLMVNYGGKVITTELNSLSTSISGYGDVDAPDLKITKDTSKTKAPVSTGGMAVFYLTMEAKQIDVELIKVFANKQTHFDGSITITDTYGKNPQRTVKFKQAALYSYSDQFSAASYGETQGNSFISLNCRELTINGVAFGK